MHIMSVGEQSSLAPLSYPDAATTKITAAATTENPSEQFIMTAAADAATCCVPPAQQRPQACGADSSVQALMGIRNSADAAVCPTSNCIEASGANDMGKAAAVSAATTSTTDLTTAAAQASNSSAPRDRQHSSSPGATAGSSSRDIAATRPTFYSDELHAAVDMPGGSHGMAGCNAGSLPATKRRSTATRTGKHPAHRLSKKARRHDTSVPLPKDARTAGELGLSLLAHGVLLQPVDAFGCHSGQWVADETILRVLAAACSGRAAPFTSGSTHYELVTCFLDSSSLTVELQDPELTSPPLNPQLILVVHTSAAGVGQHFSSIIFNTDQQLVHAFDTLGRWADSPVAAVLQSLYPNLDLLGQHYYEIRTTQA